MRLVKAHEADLVAINDLLASCIRHMRSAGIDQWDDVYPTHEVFTRDCAAGNLLLLKHPNGDLVGCAVLDQHQSPEYANVPWMYESGSVGVVHRLMIAPTHMGQGLSKVLMNHIESEARQRKHEVIRLDAFSENPAAQALYAGLGYRRAGEVRFRKGLFACFEKRLHDRVCGL